MDRTLSFKEESEATLQHRSSSSSTLKRSRSLHNPRKPFSAFSFWVSKSLKNLSHKAKLGNGVGSKRFDFNGKVMYNSVYCASPLILETKMEPFVAKNEENFKMGSFIDKNEEMDTKMESFGENGGKTNGFANGNDEYGESSVSSEFLASEVTVNEEQNSTSEDSSSTPSFAWPIMKDDDVSEEVEKPNLDNRKLEKQGSSLTELEMMKERFAKLLLGEDMSGSGNGVCAALAISNAITNLCATLFGQIWRLEPLHVEKKLMWRREMECLLCVSDHIVELIPSWQTFPDGSKLEVMTSRPRSDLYVNLPALRKLDNMLLEILDTFQNTEFWYVDQGILEPEADGSSSFRNPLLRQEEKWWLPVPRVPNCGLSENARNDLQHRRDCTNQILKATMAINSNALAEMDVPQSYLDALPKNAKASLGDIIHRYINSDQFTPECLLDCLDLSSEHQALEIANRVEASMYIWRRRNHSRPLDIANRSNSKSSWEMVKDLVTDVDKREQLADRAESLLLCLKQRFPGLPQTTLDMSKIQYNKDVGKSILESYSRVLESLAFNIVARIDDLLYVDDLTKHSDQSVSIAKVGVIAHKSVGIPLAVPVPGTPYKTAFTTPTFSPALRISPATGDRKQFLENNKNTHRGFGVKKILTDYLISDPKLKDISSEISRSESVSSTSEEISASQSGRLSESSKEVTSTPKGETHG